MIHSFNDNIIIFTTDENTCICISCIGNNMLDTCMMSLMYRRNNIHIAYYSNALPLMSFDKQFLFEKAFSKSKNIPLFISCIILSINTIKDVLVPGLFKIDIYTVNCAY